METIKERDKAVFIGLLRPGTDPALLDEYLDELEFLADTAGLDSGGRFVQRLEKPHPNTYLGSGKLQELAAYIKVENISIAIFDDELSPSQLRNLDKSLDCRILDRTNLILDIFAQRAKTAYAKTQVELAQYQYLLPRLTRMWTHLERQRGGIGMRGPGESQLETDRRIILDKIALLKEKLQKIDRQMMSQRGNRGSLTRMALVGYTNVGKSTILNLLAKTEVFAENKLFATLDTTVRKVVVDNIPFLLSDTVGFIRKLPTQLIDSFKSTLDEVREADLLLHVVDITHPEFEEHIASVNKILLDIKCNEKPVIMVFNKIDAYHPVQFDAEDLSVEKTSKHYTLEEWKATWMSKMGENNTLFISATEKDNFEEFREKVYEAVREIHITRFPYNKFLYPDYKDAVENEKDLD